MSATLGRTPQRTVALGKANDVRSLQREWKANMAARTPRDATREAARILLEAPDSVGGLTIHTFLISIPRVGEGKAQRILIDRRQGSYVWPYRKVRELTHNQRVTIAGRLLATRADTRMAG